MTNNNHPITPPPELKAKWMTEGRRQDYCSTTDYAITQAAQWGYEQCGAVNEAELQKARDEEREACCEWLAANDWAIPGGECLRDLRSARRPKPPTLKERGREALQNIHNAIVMETGGRELDVLKEIVESLPD